MSEPVSLTAADKLALLDLGYVVAAEVRWPHALRVEPDPRPLPQPVRQPGQVAIAVQVVGVKAAARNETWKYLPIRKNKQKSSRLAQLSLQQAAMPIR